MGKRAKKPTESVPEATPPPLRLEWRSPTELAENPKNWRRHPEGQASALTAAFAEVGWAGACLFNERTGLLVDGHLRRKVALEQGADKVPVLIGNWTEEQEAKILLTLDPLAAMATANSEALEALLRDVQTDSEALAGLMTDLAEKNGIIPTGNDKQEADQPPPTIKEQFNILVVCESEQEQVALLERFTTEGLQCRSLIA